MDTEEKLIYMVQKHDCLYNLTSKYYGDKHAKNNAWRKISHEMNMTAAECQKLWKNIRDGFRKSLITKQRSGSYRTKDRAIKFEKELEFIKPFLKNAPKVTTQTSLPDEEMNTNPDSQPVPSPQPESLNRTSFNEQKTLKMSSNLFKQYMELKQKEDDPTMSFFFTMGRTVQRMPGKIQAEIKREIFRIVNEAELRLETPDYSTASTSNLAPNSNELLVASSSGQLATAYNTANSYVIEATSVDPTTFIMHPLSRTDGPDPLAKLENVTSIKTEYDY